MKWLIIAYYIALPSGDYTDKLPLPETYDDFESCLAAAEGLGIVHYDRGSAMVHMCESDQPGESHVE